jgi:hypothetical protein
MKARWLAVVHALAAIGGVAGCASSGPNLRTPMPERFALPPVDDPRFSEPIAYPRETLNQDQVIKPNPAGGSKLPSQQAPPMTQPGGRPGTGPMY